MARGNNLKDIERRLIDTYPIFVSGVLAQFETEELGERGSNILRPARRRGQVKNPGEDRRLKGNRE